MNVIRILLATSVLSLVAITPVAAQSMLQKAVVSSGGGASSSASMRLDYTVAEPVTGIATNGQTIGQFGFWTASGAINLGVGDEGAGAITAMRLYPNPVANDAHLTIELAA